MKCLVIRSPWIELILEGKKTWEIRGMKTNMRGTIGLIKAGSGLLIGTAELVGCIPLTKEEYLKNKDKHLSDSAGYERIYAWVLKNAKRIDPVPYKHPHGAVVWINLD